MRIFSGTTALIIFSTTILFTGCAGDPRPVLTKFLDASLKANLEEAYPYLSSKDHAARSVSEYKETLADNPFVKNLASKTSYSIQEIKVQGSKATATVKITRPDPSQMMGAIMGAAFASAFGGQDAKATQQQIADKFAKQDLPTTTTTETFNLIKESDGWKVHLGWENAKLLSEATSLRKEHDFTGALAKLDEVLKADPDNQEAQKSRDEVVKENDGFKEKSAYFDKIKLYDLQAKYFTTYLEQREPGVDFKLKNTGDRTLKRVEVTVYFKNKSGDTISEETFNPVLVSEMNFSGDNKPLKPGYIWQQERGKFYEAKKVPNEWKEGSAIAKITNIEFQ